MLKISGHKENLEQPTEDFNMRVIEELENLETKFH